MIDGYGLVLFDFDGLLVNTEELHYRAYQQLCSRHGVELGWNFAEYCGYAHRDATALRDALQARFELFADWAPFYEEKCALYREILLGGHVSLMPGVERLLKALEERGVERAVVTHSRLEQISLIREQQPLLDSIPHWLTREDYSTPKPSPECYQAAIDRLAGPEDRVIGFEDTPRGVQALRGTRADAVMVCAPDYPLLQEGLDLGARHLTSMQHALA
jgi:HAD superfamily hydrolase (TIGR01509 family)